MNSNYLLLIFMNWAMIGAGDDITSSPVHIAARGRLFHVGDLCMGRGAAIGACKV